MTSWLTVSLALSALAACGDTTPTAGSDNGIAISVAPLTLPGLTNVCYDLRVTNGPDGTGDVVWSRGTPGLSGGLGDQDALCSTAFGDGAGGSLSFVGPCDADGQEDPGDPGGERTNSVTIWFDSIYTASGYLDPDGSDGWQNPCVDGAGTEVGCTVNVLCEENADTPVTFDFTVLRQANQGFFDIAVNFNDIFCSAKLDTCYNSNTPQEQPIELLFGADGSRDWTGVFGLACTAGAGNADTTLLYSLITVSCDDANSTTFSIDPTVTAGNAAVTEGLYTLHYGVYRGLEGLSCGAGSCNKVFWNLAFSLDDLAAVGGDCTLTLSATATDGNDGFAAGLPRAGSSAYPYIDVSQTLTTGGAAYCQENPLNGGIVTTTYHGPTGPQPAPETMCYQYDATYVGPVVDAVCGGEVRVEFTVGYSGAPVSGAAFALATGGVDPPNAVTDGTGLAIFPGPFAPGEFTLSIAGNPCTNGGSLEVTFDGGAPYAPYNFTYTGDTVTVPATLACITR